jgi:hypothetical protein
LHLLALFLLIFQCSQGYDVMMEMAKNNHTVHMILENMTATPACLPSHTRTHTQNPKGTENGLKKPNPELLVATVFPCSSVRLPTTSHSNIDKRVFTWRLDHI